MSLLDEVPVEEVRDDDDRSYIKRGEAFYIDFKKFLFQKNCNGNDIDLKCIARIPDNLIFEGSLYEIYMPVNKFVYVEDISRDLHSTRLYFIENHNNNKIVIKNDDDFNDFWSKISETRCFRFVKTEIFSDKLVEVFFKGNDNNQTPLFHTLENKMSGTPKNDIIDNSTWRFIDNILTEGDIHYTNFGVFRNSFISIGDDSSVSKDKYNLFLFANRDITTWLSFLKSSISVRLVDEDQMPNVLVPIEFPSIIIQENTANKKEGNPTKEHINGDFRYMEALGIYNSNGIEREILLCPNRIKKTAEKFNIPIDYLVAIVYIHELGHAALDETIDLDEKANYSGDLQIYIKEGEKIDTNDDKFSFVMEESLANMIMLQYINWFSHSVKGYDSFIDIAKLFVKAQSPAYAFGLHQFKANVNWLSWRNNKAIISDNQKSEWYDLFGNIMNLDIYRQSFNKLFL